jgi:L-threonylcarbamoyladenylate synthase
VTDLRVVSARQRADALAALADGQVIALAGDGGYQLAALLRLRPAVTALEALGGSVSHVAVGEQAQAMDLAAEWSRDTRLLTDRMWPGPLTVMVPGVTGAIAGPVVHLTMPGARPMRVLSRDIGPLAIASLRGADGQLVRTVAEVAARVGGNALALVVDGGTCRGEGPTVVDCTMSPPRVRSVGALPESFVDAALMMGNRRRSWFAKRLAP